MKTIFSVDLEGDWDSEETDSFSLVLPRLLDFFRDNNIKATFFVVANLIKDNKELMKQIAKKHELASHSNTHRRFNSLSLKEIEDEIKTSKKEIEKLGTECLGFRAPHFITHQRMFSLLKKHGYVYDSSFSPSIFPGRYINLGKPKNIEIKEIPISKFMLKLPFSLSYIRAFYPISMKFIPQKPRHFYLHSYEFLEKKPGKEIPFHVRQVCKRNQGKAAWKILEEVINRLDTEFVSCRDYLKNKV
ncbi:MAG TPA: polysaccharide deacetylase family protein [Candidatus Nanoarchaeia archaeon]|nr:polysaccharide deacetylase family protein [Candidatus Nanoarchaeia archaeon]